MALPLTRKDCHPCTLYPRHHEVPTHHSTLRFGHQLLGILQKEERIVGQTEKESVQNTAAMGRPWRDTRSPEQRGHVGQADRVLYFHPPSQRLCRPAYEACSGVRDILLRRDLEGTVQSGHPFLMGLGHNSQQSSSSPQLPPFLWLLLRGI